MIFIKRHPEPEFLRKANNKWKEETDRAIAYYTGTSTEKEFEFQHYRDSEMKKALMENFPKCVYCESSYAGVSDGDIEHFRPKGRVLGKNPPYPGYYWLANSWENLFMSCMHCNQVRKHKMYSDEEARAMGKLDQFPLHGDESVRVISHTANLSAEEPYRLLLNPSIDKPEEHLAYDENALISSGTDKGKNTIEVCVLQRPYLVRERQLRLVLLSMLIETAKRTLSEYNATKEPRLRALLDGQLDGMKMFTEVNQPYAGMCRFFVKRFLKENGLL